VSEREREGERERERERERDFGRNTCGSRNGLALRRTFSAAYSSASYRYRGGPS
jgi:hypothetical protein